ncbi:hypothetical protein ACFX13_027975 [Malus domestica]
MSCPSDCRINLNVGEDIDMSSPDNIWHLSFVSPNGLLTVGDSMMMNDTTASVVARNLLTPRDTKILSRRSDELAIQDSLAYSVRCVGSVSNMGQRLLARSRQVESLMAEVASLRQEVRVFRHENKELHMLATNYSISMKMKLDQLQESEVRIQSDHQRFVALLQRQLLPLSSGASPSVEAPKNQSLVLHLSGGPSNIEAPPDQ